MWERIIEPEEVVLSRDVVAVPEHQLDHVRRLDHHLLQDDLVDGPPGPLDPADEVDDERHGRPDPEAGAVDEQHAPEQDEEVVREPEGVEARPLHALLRGGEDADHREVIRAIR